MCQGQGSAKRARVSLPRAAHPFRPPASPDAPAPAPLSAGLDVTALSVLAESGEPVERAHAARILPLRRRGNLLLCTLLLGNTVVNACISILLANVTSGAVGLLVSTAIIVIFGEIIPQAICSKHGLAVGARCIWLVLAFRLLLLPVAWPISLALDRFLGGEELGSWYSREELKALIVRHYRTPEGRNESDLTAADTMMLTGVLDFAGKPVGSVCTELRNVAMLNVDAQLGFEELFRVYASGFTRIPVYEGRRQNVVGMLHAKDLILLDPHDRVSVRAVVTYHSRSLRTCDKGCPLQVALSYMLNQHRHMLIVTEQIDAAAKGEDLAGGNLGAGGAAAGGGHCHLHLNSDVLRQLDNQGAASMHSSAGGASAESIRSEDRSTVAPPGADLLQATARAERRVLGVVTLEDVLEEILRHEIVDETDTTTENRGVANLYDDARLRVVPKKDRPGQILALYRQYMATHAVGSPGGELDEVHSEPNSSTCAIASTGLLPRAVTEPGGMGALAAVQGGSGRDTREVWRPLLEETGVEVDPSLSPRLRRVTSTGSFSLAHAIEEELRGDPRMLQTLSPVKAAGVRQTNHSEPVLVDSPLGSPQQPVRSRARRRPSDSSGQSRRPNFGLAVELIRSVKEAARDRSSEFAELRLDVDSDDGSDDETSRSSENTEAYPLNRAASSSRRERDASPGGQSSPQWPHARRSLLLNR